MSEKKVKVRIAVVVDENGDWSSIGYRNMDDEEMSIAADGCEGMCLRYFWLSVELPTPSAEAIEADAVAVTEVKP